MAIQKISRIDRIEIALGDNETARGAFVTMVEGYWDDEASAWDVPPTFYQVPLSISPDDRIAAKLADVLGQSYADLAAAAADRLSKISALETQIDGLQQTIAALQAQSGSG
jgi:hypothetical protein